MSIRGSILCSKLKIVSSSVKLHTSLCGSTQGQYLTQDSIAWSANDSSFYINLPMALISYQRNWLKFCYLCIGNRHCSQIYRCSAFNVSLNPSIIGTSISKYSEIPKVRSETCNSELSFMLSMMSSRTIVMRIENRRGINLPQMR